MASDGTVAARLFVEVGARGLNETASGLGRMDSAVRGTSMGIGGLVRAAGGIYAVKKGFDATIGSAIAWESEFAGVEKTVEGTEAELAGLEGTLLGMHRTMPIARADLAGIAEAAGALGIKTPDIAAFTETVAMIGETTNVSSDQAASALGKLSNVLHLTADDYDNFGAALVDLGNKGASTEQEILGIAEQAGAGASLIKIAADETLGWSAAVANLGIEAQAGGSALQRFFLGAAEHVGKAGEELDAMARTAGVSAAEFKRAFDEDASGALQRFIDGMGDLSQAEQIALLDLLGFADVRITRTLLGLAGNTENLTSALEVGADAWSENTALTVEYGKRAETTAAKIEVLGNRLGDLGRRLGESQGGPVDWVIGAVEASVTGWERNFIEAEVRFGNHGDRIEALAVRAGHSLLQRGLFSTGMADQVVANATKWGTSVDQTITLMEQGMTPALLEQGAAWEAYQKQISVGTQQINRDFESLENPVESYRLAMDGLSTATEEEMAEARETAVEGMAAIMSNLNDALRDGKEGYEQSWEDYLEGQKDPFTTAQRSAFIAGQFTGTEFDSGLHSKDPEHVANTVEYVNAQLAEFNLLVPGALQTGKDVPANLQAGMDEIMPELQQYVMEKTGETLANLSLEEAQQLGLDGIWYWFQGMQAAEADNKFVAGAIASRAVNQLDASDTAYAGGYATGASFMNGITSAFAAKNPEVVTALNYQRRQLGGSLPEIGPLAGGVGDGGESVGDDWIERLVRSIHDGTSDVSGALGGVGAHLNAALGTPALDMDFPAIATGAGGGGYAAASAAGGEFVIHTHIHLDGREIYESVDRQAHYDQTRAGILPRN